MPISDATLELARRLGAEDGRDAIMLAREAPSEVDKNTFDMPRYGSDYSPDRPGKPARRLASDFWDSVHDDNDDTDGPLSAQLPGGAETWKCAWAEIEVGDDPETEVLKAMDVYTDAFFETIDAADVFPLHTFCYPGEFDQTDREGTPVFSLYVIDGRRYSEFHKEHWLGREFDGDWLLAEGNVQKVYSEPKRSLRQRLFGRS